MKLAPLEEEKLAPSEEGLHFWPGVERGLEAHLAHEEPSGEVVAVAEGSSHAVEPAEEVPEVLDFDWEVLAVQILSVLLGKEEVHQTDRSPPLVSLEAVAEVEVPGLPQNLPVGA